jgi:hypothetical protein
VVSNATLYSRESRRTKLTNHAVDTVELGGKQVGVGGLVLGRRSANEGLDRRHGGDGVPCLVQDTVLDGSGRVRAVLGRSNAAVYTSQRTSHCDDEE